MQDAEKIKELLTRWVDLKLRLMDFDRLEQEQIDKILTPELKRQIEDIRFEFGQKKKALQENLVAAEKEAKAAVFESGKTQRADHVLAKHCRGRVTWNSQGLDAYVAEHPEILFLRKQGDDYVTLELK